MWVRTAGKHDLEAVRAILVATWHDTYDSIYGFDRVTEITDSWHSLEALERNLITPGSEFLVADDGKTLGGMAYAFMRGENSCKLSQLYILPAFQGRGVGHDLMSELETCFPQAQSMSLEVEPQNEGAILFYEKLGFEKSGEIENCGADGSGIKANIYSKSLSEWDL